MPRGRSSGNVITTDWSTARDRDVARLARGIDQADHAGVTLSLKRNCTVFGACASTLPSAGSVETSDACANAPVARQSADSSAARPAIRRASSRLYGFGISLTPGAGDLLSCAWPAPFAGNIDPAADPLLAFLHHRKIQRGVRLQAAGEKGADDEFIVIVVRQLAAAPHHLLDAFGQFAAVIVVFGWRICP